MENRKILPITVIPDVIVIILCFALTSIATVRERCCVPAKDIAEAARFFAKSKPASIHWGLPIDSTPGITPTAALGIEDHKWVWVENWKY